MAAEVTARPVVVRAGNEVRGTQSFVQVMAAVWRRPSLTGLEMLWRWMFGTAALWLLGTNAWRIWMAATAGTGAPASLGLDHLTVTDPMGASVKIGAAMVALLPMVEHTGRWLAPVLFTAWMVVSAMGRAVVLRRMDAGLRPKVVTLVWLGAVRLAFLVGTFCLWLWGLVAAGELAISGPAGRGSEPNLVMYFALVIIETLVLFIAWAAASWVLSIAPMLAAVRGLGVGGSLRAALQLGPLRGKLVEINLVMGIVKVALVVLAMVFSACPLPFESYTTDGFLLGWWIGVSVLYVIASDYFHVVRLAACLELWRAYAAPGTTLR